MAVVVVLQLAVSQVPDLDGTIPAARHNDGVGVVRRETHARHPVSVAILLDGELALGQSVPQLDGLVPRARHDLTVISREGNRQHILQSQNKISKSTKKSIIVYNNKRSWNKFMLPTYERDSRKSTLTQA